MRPSWRPARLSPKQFFTKSGCKISVVVCARNAATFAISSHITTDRLPTVQRVVKGCRRGERIRELFHAKTHCRMAFRKRGAIRMRGFRPMKNLDNDLFPCKVTVPFLPERLTNT